MKAYEGLLKWFPTYNCPNCPQNFTYYWVNQYKHMEKYLRVHYELMVG